jgi:hypothetical protein
VPTPYYLVRASAQKRFMTLRSNGNIVSTAPEMRAVVVWRSSSQPPEVFPRVGADPRKCFPGLDQVSENVRSLAGANSILPGQSVCAKTFRDSM